MRIVLPDGGWIEIRKLSQRKLAKACDVELNKALLLTERAGGLAAVLRARCADCRQLKHDGPCLPMAECADQSELSPTVDYDDETLLRLSIGRWGYPEPITAKSISALGEPATAAALAAIVLLNKLTPSPETMAADAARTSAEIRRVQSKAGGA